MPEAIIARAGAADVQTLLTVCCEIAKEAEDLRLLAEGHKNLWCSVGTHPHEAAVEAEKAYSVKDIVALCSHPKVIGIGESGLDYYYMHSPQDEQIASFRKHIQACLESKLPLIVHSRDAEADTMRILKEEAAGTDLKGVMHCFSSGPQLAEEAVEFGFYISFSGILTFKKSEELREIAKRVPKSQLLIETDSPFLAPQPYRGKVNEPAYVIHVNEVLADLHQVSASEMAQITTNNFFTLFQKAQRP